MSAEPDIDACLPKRGPLLIVLSGPSGVGKDAILARMRRLHGDFHYTVTTTTRSCRPQERDGVDYCFVPTERFQQMIADGEFMEWAQVYGNWYGVPKSQVRDALARGQDVFIKTDVQGAATIKRIAPQGIFIFVAPRSFSELEHRIRLRHAEADFDLSLRLATARDELQRLPLFDYVVINPEGQLDCAIRHIESIIEAEKCRVSPRIVEV